MKGVLTGRMAHQIDVDNRLEGVLRKTADGSQAKMFIDY